jgi:hypothetical protein
MISGAALHRFGERFVWTNLVPSIRDFVFSGAKNWYQGLLSSHDAENVLQSQSQDGRIYFLIRAVNDNDGIQINDYKNIFVISYRQTNKEIIHEPIFRDQFDRLSMINEADQPIFFESFAKIIDEVVGKDAIEVPNCFFQNLQKNIVEACVAYPAAADFKKRPRSTSDKI